MVLEFAALLLVAAPVPATQAAADTQSASPAQPAPAAPVEPAPVAPAAPPATNTTQPGDIVVTGELRPPSADPLQAINAQSYEATQNVDEAVVGPMAMAYKKAVPSPLRSGLHNVLSNLTEPVVFLNYLLQFKPGKAAETLARFTANSTVGIGGLVDVAKRKPIGLPRRPNGFAHTLGYYGVKPGAFLFLPLIGPTTVRDLIGGGIDRMVLPTAIGSPFNKLEYSLSTGVISSLDRRVEIDAELTLLRLECPNPYAALREAYLERRQAEIDAIRSPNSGKPMPRQRIGKTCLEGIDPALLPAPPVKPN